SVPVVFLLTYTPHPPGGEDRIMSDPNPNITGAPGPAPDAPAAPAAAAAPPKPAAAAAPKPAAKPAAKGKERRFFLFAIFASWFSGGWAAFTDSMGIMTLSTV